MKYKQEDVGKYCIKTTATVAPFRRSVNPLANLLNKLLTLYQRTQSAQRHSENYSKPKIVQYAHSWLSKNRSSIPSP